MMGEFYQAWWCVSIDHESEQTECDQSGQCNQEKSSVFFKEKETNGFLETYKKYYWWNDMHFNVEGNKVVAREISKILK